MTIEFARNLSSQPLPADKRTAALENPGFGRIYTDHMVTITWTPDQGWHDAQIRPYGPLSLDPATAVFHYGQSIFEGFKAYVQPDGSIKTFRPDANGRRFQRSAHRLALPELPVDDFVAAGANGMTIHAEAAPHLHRQLRRIRELGCMAGVALNPATPLSAVCEIIPEVDLLLIMSVNPGFGGQRFIPYAVDKVRRARLMLDEEGSRAALEVDGGVGRETIQEIWAAGADTFVAGNAIFSAQDAKGEINKLRGLCGVPV